MTTKFYVHDLLRNTLPGHDKVWGYCSTKTWPDHRDPIFVFYGATGKSLTFKQHEYGTKLAELVNSKIRKGYDIIDDLHSIDTLYPDFQEQATDKLPMVILSQDKYKAAE